LIGIIHRARNSTEGEQAGQGGFVPATRCRTIIRRTTRRVPDFLRDRDGVSKLSSSRRMGGYGPPSRVMPNRLSSISMLMVWTVTPPCRSFIRFRCSNRPPGGEHAKKNQQRNDFHFFPHPSFLILCQASMTPTLLVELGLKAIRHPRRLVLYRARYTTGRAHRRHRRCRHVRRPMAD
jgi:hypothetical protein